MVRQNIVLPYLPQKWYGHCPACRTGGAAHGHFGASSYTGWPKKWGDCVWLATSLTNFNQLASLLAYFNIVLYLNTVTEVTWLTVNKFAVRVILLRNKSRYLSLYIAILGYKIDENNLKKLCGRPPQYAPPLQVDLWPFGLGSGVWVKCDVGYTSDAHRCLMPLP